MIKVLGVASEIFPLVKTGGLADVAGALPAALQGEGVAMRTLVPGYPSVMAALTKAETVARHADLFGGDARLLAGKAEGLDLLVLDAPHLYDRPGNPYLDRYGHDWPDNWRRFAALSKIAAGIGEGALKGYVPDVVHAHDWQTALTPLYLRHAADHAARTVLTVHNLAFQGRFPADIFPALGLPPEAFSMDGLEYYGGVGFLKGGLASADAITTVSPTYAEEIKTQAHGMGLDGLLRARESRLSGIVNGIDTAIWDPASDPQLEQGFDARSLSARRANKRAVEKVFGLARSKDMLFCIVSRLTWQKGMDILLAAVDGLVASGARLALIGTGDHALEGGFLAAAQRHPRRIGVHIGYDEHLSHLMQGGADAILVPSRFEPCGLTQLYGLHYGCVPVVARVGGLADTVIHANDAALTAGVATGFHHEPDSADALAQAIHRAAMMFRNDTRGWRQLQRNGMKADVSWHRSAARYADLYRRLASA